MTPDSGAVDAVTIGGTSTVEIDAIGAGGVGVGRLDDGRVVFVPRSAPGDRVRVRVERRGGRWTRGEIEEILVPSQTRVPAPCPHYERCGGCALQHMRYRDQREWKGRIVADALTRIGGIAIDPPPVAASPAEWRYRNRVTFTLRRLPSGRVLAGFHERTNSNRIVDVGIECLLPAPALSEVWDALRASWGPRACHLPSGDPLRLTLRQAEGQVALVVEGAEGPGAPGILLDAVPGLASIWVRDPEGRHRLLRGGGRGGGRGERGGTPNLSFVQTNDGASAIMTAVQVAMLRPGPGVRILDAFGGSGALGGELARAGAEVVSIERDPEAVQRAREAAPPGQRVVEGAVEERLARELPADAVHLNPPRGGIDSAVADQLLAEPPARIVYTSCDPATLARDLARLDAGFGVEEVQGFDVFPQTAAVEAVVLLHRRKPGAP